jgi:hypothetical protein
MVMRILGPRREEGVAGCRRLHNELHNLYTSNIIRLIKSRRIRQAGHVALMREMRNG